jgi:hypothetical protein
MRRSGLLARCGIGLLAPTLTLALAAPAQAQPGSLRPDIAGDWLDQTVAAAAASGDEASARRVWAIGWLSAQRALTADHAIDPRQRPSFEDAAVATAVHDVQVTLVPSRAEPLDAALARSLAAIPDGPGERAGIRAGQRAAVWTLRERDGDGLDPDSVNRPFPDPPAEPGVYRLPADARTPTQLAGMSQVRPFLLGEADRFRPGPPPGLDTATYRRDLDEVRRLGCASCPERTPEQSEIALLWVQSGLTAYTPALRALIADRGRVPTWKVRLLAAFAVTTLDAGIAVADSKYAYLRWRPITAIRESGDPSWSPLRGPPPPPPEPPRPPPRATHPRPPRVRRRPHRLRRRRRRSPRALRRPAQPGAVHHHQRRPGPLPRLPARHPVVGDHSGGHRRADLGRGALPELGPDRRDPRPQGRPLRPHTPGLISAVSI